jgi:cell division protein FtsQ
MKPVEFSNLNVIFKKNLKYIYLVLFLPGILFVLNEIAFPGFFDKSTLKVNIIGLKRLKKEDIYSYGKIKTVKSIQSSSLSDLEYRLSDHPRIQSVNVEKKPKNTYEISIKERDAIFIINTGDTLYEVDSEFRILSIDDVREEGLCVLSGEFTPQDGRFSGAVIKEFASSVTRALKSHPNLKKRISEIELRNDGNVMAYVHYPSHIRVNAGLSLEEQQVRKLYAALAYFENKKIMVKSLDLRGDDAVFQ